MMKQNKSHLALTFPVALISSRVLWLSVSFWAPVSRGHWQRSTIKPIYYKPLWGAGLGLSALQSPAHPSTGEQRARSAWGVTKGIPNPLPKPTRRDRATGGAQSCEIIHELDLEGEGKKKKAMSFKVLEMFLFGFSRNKSKEPFALNHGDKKKQRLKPSEFCCRSPARAHWKYFFFFHWEKYLIFHKRN